MFYIISTVTEDQLNGASESGISLEEFEAVQNTLVGGLRSIQLIFSGPLAITLGSIALVVGVISYLISTSTDMSPILRLLLKVVFALSLLTGGFSIVNGLFSSCVIAL